MGCKVSGSVYTPFPNQYIHRGKKHLRKFGTVKMNGYECKVRYRGNKSIVQITARRKFNKSMNLWTWKITIPRNLKTEL